MSAYKEFTGKSVEEALRGAREEFGVDLADLDFEILTPGSRGVLGMGAEPARIVAAPRSALGGAAPKREAAAAAPLPARPPREDRPRDDRGPRRDDRGDRGPRRDDRADRDRGPRHEDRGRPRERRPERTDTPEGGAPIETADRGPRREDRPRDDRGRRGGGDRGPRREERGGSGLNADEAAQVAAARGSVASERADLEAAEASPEALQAGREILEELMKHLGFDVRIEVETGDTSRLNVVGGDDGHEALGALIGRKGERLSALQHLVNLMLSRRMGEWTRVLVDVEDYRGRRERQLRDIALRAAARVLETGKMLQLEPMPALERRWIHLALRDHPDVATQSIGEEPNRRIVVLLRGG
ncbi:MAG TPA: RNA-binding cell elongation regulator Jag/EloR [Candidatus Limnocylindrales bacterium]|nr:RNA-binding cell elongation regulator Jag/EloR [Candidatus Limnocylindrales bacterium]HEU4920482.1 RNA-binding cell elongation regulator Jag/EloR [Candidatus Limnocylindrales bacterium]